MSLQASLHVIQWLNVSSHPVQLHQRLTYLTPHARKRYALTAVKCQQRGRCPKRTMRWYLRTVLPGLEGDFAIGNQHI